MVVALAVVGAETVAALLEPWPIKVVLDTVLRAKALPVVGTGGGEHGRHDQRVGSRGRRRAVIVIAVIGAIGGYVEKQIVAGLGQQVGHELRCRIYTHAQRLSMSYHDKKRTGDIISTATADVDAIQGAVTSGVLDTVSSTLLLVGMASLMLYLDWRFTLIALSILPALGVVVYTLTRRIKRASREVRGREADLVSTMHEALSSIRLVKAFGREDHERRRFDDQSAQIVDSTLRARDVKAKLSPTVEIIVAVGSAAVLWFGARHVLDGRLTAGALVVFLLYLGKMYKPIRDLSKMTETYSRALVSLDRINRFLDLEAEVRDLPGARRARRFRGRIDFDNVTFGYAPDRPALVDGRSHDPGWVGCGDRRPDGGRQDDPDQSHRAILRPAVRTRIDRRKRRAVVLPGIVARVRQLRVAGHPAVPRGGLAEHRVWQAPGAAPRNRPRGGAGQCRCIHS